MTFPFAQRIQKIEPFRVVEVLTRAKALEAEGRDIVHLEVGEPDFPIVEPITLAAKTALDKGLAAYSPAAGLDALREAISVWYAKECGLDIPARRIMITPGASGALLLIAGLLIEPGRSMLMTDPGYPCNRNFLRVFGGQEQMVPVGPEDNYQLTAAKAEQNWRESTVGVMVASPSNPTGTLISPNELDALHQLCVQKGGYLVVDEIYQNLVYGAAPASVLSITDRAFVINSFSKFFGMTGWRLGWLVAPDDAVPSMEKLAQNLFISLSTPAQYAALAGFSDACQALLIERKHIFAKRRNYLLPELKRLGFAIDADPDGAFYIYANIRQVTSLSSQDFCLQMLEEHGVAITPGADFGQYQSNDHVRFAYTTSMDRMQEAISRMEKILPA